MVCCRVGGGTGQEDLVKHEWLNSHAVGAATVSGAFQARSISGRIGGALRSAGRSAEGGRAQDRCREKRCHYEDLGIQQAPNSTLVSYLQKMLWILTGNFAIKRRAHALSWLFPIAGSWYPVGKHRRRLPNQLRRRGGLGGPGRGSRAAAEGIREAVWRCGAPVRAGDRAGCPRLLLRSGRPTCCGKRCRATQYTGRRHAQSRHRRAIISGLIPAATFPSRRSSATIPRGSGAPRLGGMRPILFTHCRIRHGGARRSPRSI